MEARVNRGRVVGGCELPGVCAENLTGSFARRVHVIRASDFSSPCPNYLKGIYACIQMHFLFVCVLGKKVNPMHRFLNLVVLGINSVLCAPGKHSFEALHSTLLYIFKLR